MKKLLKYFLAFGLTVFLASGLLAQNGFVGSGYIMQAPRCTRATIASPYKGLIIYDTVALHYFGYTPNGWQILDSGSVDPSNLQYLTPGFGLKSNGNYNTLDPRTFSIDDSIVALKSDLDFVVGNDTPNYIIDTIINAPLASPVPGITYLVGTAPTGIFVGHANQPADFVTGTTYTYHTPLLGDQGVVGRPFEYIYYDGTNWIVKPNKAVQTYYYDYGSKIFIGQAKAKDIDIGVSNTAVLTLTSTGKLRLPYLTYVPAHPFLTVNPLDSNSVILDSFDVAIYFDSLRNNSGVLEGRKAGAWIPQFTLPTGGGGGSFNFDSALATKTTDNLTQGSTNLYNQTHTGDATGATALTVVGIRTKSIPTLSAGFLKYSGSAWTFDNSTYLTSYTETDPLALKITNNLSDVASAAISRTNLGATTVGANLFTLSNPSAIRYIQINADNSITLNSANAHLNALLPSQTSNSGKVLQTDGTNTSWQTAAAGATVYDSTITATAAQTAFNFSTIATPTATKNVFLSIDGIDLNTTFWSRSSTTYTITDGLQAGQLVRLRIVQ